MELTSTSRLRRNGKIVQTETRAKSASTEKPRTAHTPTDRLTLSQQALTYLDEWNQRNMEAIQRRQERQQAQMQGLSEKSALLDSMEKSLKVLNKCQKIAARIMAGDKVPPEDEKYLMDQDPEGYKLALAMRKPKKNPKKWDTVLEEEDRNPSSVEQSSGEESGDVSVESASGSEGGDCSGGTEP